MRRVFRRFRHASAVAIVVCGLVVASCARREASESATTNAAVSVRVELARVETLKNTFVGSGLVVPAAATDWTIVSAEPARIASLPKAEGEAVAVGDVLVRFDVASLKADLTARELEHSDAMTRLESAKAELTKLAALHAQGIVPRNEVDAATNRAAQAESAVKHAKTELDAATLMQDRAVVRARFAGVVARRFRNEGDLVSSGTDPVLRVIDPKRVQVAVQVPASQLAQVVPGTAASVLTPTGGPAEPATVVLRNAPDSGTAAAEVRLTFVNPTTVTVDTPVQVEILLEQRAGVVVVPRTALAYERERPFVFIAGGDNRAYRRDVRVGLIVQELAQILSGVQAGDRVIISRLDELTDGALISADR